MSKDLEMHVAYFEGAVDGIDRDMEQARFTLGRLEQFKDLVPLYRNAVTRIRSLEIENGNLRQLIQCVECSELLGDAEPDGWMPSLCPGCQAEWTP